MNQNRVQQAATILIGHKLSAARRAADMRIFHFGTLRAGPRGTVGQYALHVQCAWRIEGRTGIVTGHSDLWEHISGHPLPAEWEPSISDNLQDGQLGQLLGGYDPTTQSHINTGNGLVVEQVHASAVGDLDIHLAGGYRLILFPNGSRGEEWRLFEPGKDTPHFVIEAGETARTYPATER